MYGIQNGSNTIWLQLNAIILYLLSLLNDTPMLHVHMLMMNDKMLSLSSWTIVDPNLTLPLVVFIGILMGVMTLWVLSDVVKISKFVEFLYGYVILTY